MRRSIFVAALIALALVAEFAAADSQRSDDCQVTDLTTVFQNPLQYGGQTFCGEAIFFAGQRVYWFYDISVDISFPPSTSDYPTLVPGKVRPRILDHLETGDLVMLKGRLEPESFCFQEGNFCTIFRKPIEIEDLRILSVTKRTVAQPRR